VHLVTGGPFPSHWAGIHVLSAPRLKNERSGDLLAGGREFIGMIWTKTSAWKVFWLGNHQGRVRLLSRSGFKADRLAR